MNIYIWQRLQQVSPNYHSGGGLVVIARTQNDAIALAEADANVKVDNPPDRVEELAHDNPTLPAVYVFPDAGCC